MGKKNHKGSNRSSDKKEKNWLHKYSRFVNLFIIVAGVSYAYVLIHEKWSEITALSMVSGTIDFNQFQTGIYEQDHLVPDRLVLVRGSLISKTSLLMLIIVTFHMISYNLYKTYNNTKYHMVGNQPKNEVPDRLNLEQNRCRI